jgi:dihydrodipicolinate synthase/N-acetylneuraminate lyase
VYPDLIGRLYREYLDGDRETTMKTQEQVIMVRQITKYGPTVPTCHAILKLRGIDAGYPRLPFQPVSPEIEEKVKVSLKGMNLL